MRVALSIAGSDPSGGAGIQADLKTFHQFGVYGMAAITALTAQNTVGVSAVHVVPPEFLRQQLQALAADLPPDAIKTGMLADVQLAATVADSIRAFGWTPLVVDPVMIATSGDRLLSVDAEQVIRDRLLPLATLVTPNLDEASLLTGLEVRDVAQMERAGTVMLDMGAAAVLMKGGHLAGRCHRRPAGDAGRDAAVQSPADPFYIHARDGLHAVSGDHGRAGERADARSGGRGRARLCGAGHRERAGAGRGAWAGEPPVLRPAGWLWGQSDLLRPGSSASRAGAPGSGKGERTQEFPFDPMPPCVRRSPPPGAPSLLASLFPLPCSLFPVPCSLFPLPRRSPLHCSASTVPSNGSMWISAPETSGTSRRIALLTMPLRMCASCSESVGSACTWRST